MIAQPFSHYIPTIESAYLVSRGWKLSLAVFGDMWKVGFLVVPLVDTKVLLFRKGRGMPGGVRNPI